MARQQLPTSLKRFYLEKFNFALCVDKLIVVLKWL